MRGHYDLVVETAGAPSTAADACLLARRGGRVILTGMFTPGAVGIDPVHLSLSQLTVRSVFGAPSAAWSYAVRAFTAGLLDPAPLITHEFPLERFADAVALVGSGTRRPGRCCCGRDGHALIRTPVRRRPDRLRTGVLPTIRTSSEIPNVKDQS